MKKHRFDPVSFIFGAAFVALAIVAMTTSHSIGLRWFSWAGAGLLILGGLSMVFGSRTRAKDGDR
jgi:hypothetical protein